MLDSFLTRRRSWVVWLYVMVSGHLLASMVVTWAAPSGLFDNYLSSLEEVFWTSAAPASARAQQTWWLALFGATLQSYSLYMLALVHIGNRLKTPMVWGWLIAGLVLWAPQDIVLSLQVGVWSHLWLDTFAMLMLLPPLVWLYRHDRNHQRGAAAQGSGNV